MLIRLFRSDVSYQILIILFISGLLWINAFIHPPAVPASASDLLMYQNIYRLFSGWPLLSVIIAFVIVIAEAVFLNLLLNAHDLTPRNSALAAILYIILMSWSPSMLTLNPMLFSNAVLLVYLYMFLNVFETKEAYQQVFSSAFLIAIAAFFDIAVAWLFLLLIIGMLVYRIFSWREWFIALIGFLLPFYFSSIYFFWNGEFISFATTLLKILKPHFTVAFHLSWIPATFLIIFGILMLWTMLAVLNIVQEKVIAIRKKYITIIWFFIIALICLPLPSPDFAIRTSILFIPAASLLSYYFGLLKKLWVMEIIFGAMFLMIVLNRF